VRSAVGHFNGLGALAGGNYALPGEAVGERERAVFNALAARVSKIGEPFQLFFMPGKLRGSFRQSTGG